MTEHTPGPWELTQLIADGFVITRGGYEIRTPAHDVCAWLHQGAPIRRLGDARLIAAAPDLLAACKMAVDNIERLGVERGVGRMGMTLGALDYAIAKAKGERCTESSQS